MRREVTGIFLTIFAVLAISWFTFIGRRYLPETLSEETGIVLAISATTLGAFLVYKLSSRLLRATIIRAKGTEGDVKMILSFWKFIVGFLALLIILSAFFQLGAIAAVMGAFGGMFLGWSLQAPVTGFVAWILIIVLRPFRVGDRVQLPSYGLVGDVVNVGPMYTVLNQVGGTVGSEEPVNRHVLVPNTMLFASIVLNYTPRLEKEKIKVYEPIVESTTQPSYLLDEIVYPIRLGSNIDEAEKIMLDAARGVTADIIKQTGQEPYIRGEAFDGGVNLRLRFMTLATDRPRISFEIGKRIFKKFMLPFREGDRVRLPAWDITGDVLDIGPVFTVLSQVGGSVGSEDPVNRTVMIPNSFLQGTWLINYTPGPEKTQPMTPPQSYILDEVVWRITFDSDWNEAERILLEAAHDVTADIIKQAGQEPFIRSEVYDYGIYMRLRYLAPATDRPRITHEINKRVFAGFSANPKVDFAIPYIYSYKRGREWAPPSVKERLEKFIGEEEQFIKSSVKCAHCGAENTPHAKTCSNCGKYIE